MKRLNKQKEPVKSEYDLQAESFIDKTGLKIEKVYQGHRPYFGGDKAQRAVWSITFKRKDCQDYTFTFGDSIMNSYKERDDIYGESSLALNKTVSQKTLRLKGFKEAVELGGGFIRGSLYLVKAKNEPTDYDILSAVEKHDPGTFQDFCDNFGYDTDSRKAEKLYFRVQEQFTAINTMFSEPELEELCNIQ